MIVTTSVIWVPWASSVGGWSFHLVWIVSHSSKRDGAAMTAHTLSWFADSSLPTLTCAMTCLLLGAEFVYGLAVSWAVGGDHGGAAEADVVLQAHGCSRDLAFVGLTA